MQFASVQFCLSWMCVLVARVSMYTLHDFYADNCTRYSRLYRPNSMLYTVWRRYFVPKGGLYEVVTRNRQD